MTVGSLAVVAFLAGSAAGPLAPNPAATAGTAVGPGTHPAQPGDTIPSVEEVVRSGLDEVAAAFTWAWSEAYLERIRAHLAPEPQRIRLQLGPTRHTGLNRRQATAALRAVLEERHTSASDLEQVNLAGGDPERGFAEVAWSSVPAGTNQRITYTVYVGFLRMGEEWRVTEIRVLR